MADHAPKLAVTEQNRAPLYHQLFMILRGKIHDGEYPTGSILPGENELAALYDVSRITANRALKELAAAGLVIRQKGRGTIVRASVAGKVTRGPAEFDFDREDGNPRAVPRLLEFAYEPAPAPIAATLGLAKGAPIQRAVRMWFVGGRPYNHLTTFVDAEIGKSWTKREMAERPLNALLTAKGFVIDRIDEAVTATLADVALARDLDVAVGAPLLKIVRTSFDPAGRALEHLVAFYPPDRYEYRATLERRDVARDDRL